MAQGHWGATGGSKPRATVRLRAQAAAVPVWPGPIVPAPPPVQIGRQEPRLCLGVRVSCYLDSQRPVGPTRLSTSGPPHPPIHGPSNTRPHSHLPAFPRSKASSARATGGGDGETMSTRKVTIIPSARLRPCSVLISGPKAPQVGEQAEGGSLEPTEAGVPRFSLRVNPLPSVDTSAGPSSVRGGPHSCPEAVVTRSKRGAHTGKVEAEVGSEPRCRPRPHSPPGPRSPHPQCGRHTETPRTGPEGKDRAGGK